MKSKPRADAGECFPLEVILILGGHGVGGRGMMWKAQLEGLD